MTTAIVSTSPNAVTPAAINPIVAMVLDAVGSDRTRRDYGRALNDFIVWYQSEGQTALNKAAVNAHVAALKAKGVTPASINQRLSAIRKLAREAADNGLIDHGAAEAIARAEGVKQLGRKSGNWLTKTQAEAMINAPDASTLKGKRDRAILAVMLGCGLRREEVARLELAHLQQREGRWVILDLRGKHGRVRTVPMGAWVKSIIDVWTDAARLDAGPLFRPMRKGGRIQPGGMTSQAIWKIVQEYAPVKQLAPHDLRRTFAKLAHKAGAPVEQIQQSLGHASLQTTERYLGVTLDLQRAPSDVIVLDV